MRSVSVTSPFTKNVSHHRLQIRTARLEAHRLSLPESLGAVGFSYCDSKPREHRAVVVVFHMDTNKGVGLLDLHTQPKI